MIFLGVKEIEQGKAVKFHLKSFISGNLANFALKQ